MSTPLQVGDKAPSFTTNAVGTEYGSGTALKLTDLKGAPVVLYFYPKDDTPGCTTQACGIRDAWKEIKASGARLFGVSIDTVKSHEKFIVKFDLPFPLLTDPEKAIVEAYGVWVEKSMYGKKYMGVERSTFIIGPTGTLEHVLHKVKPGEHLDLIVKAING